MGPPPFLWEERMKKRKALSLAVTVLTALLCASLCASVLALYFSGARSRAESGSALTPIFTREAVARQLMWVYPVLGLWLIAVIAARIGQAERAWKKSLPPRTPMKTIKEAPGKNVLRLVLFAAAGLFIVLGVLNGGLNDVLVKAINICTECIGLG